MSGAISVRRTGPDDWATIRQMRLAALADTPTAFASTLEHEEAFSEQDWRGRAESAAWFVAWQDGDPVGVAAAIVPPPGSGQPGQPEPPQEWHLISMWASPQVRGRGVAGLLVDAVARYVKGAGAQRLALWVSDGNDRARGFYRRAGFRPTGRRQRYRRRDGSAFDEDELALDLTGLTPQR